MSDHEKELEARNNVLFIRNLELTRQLMFRSAKQSESAEEAERLCSEMKLHRAQDGHNKCWKNDWALHKAIGDNQPCACPDPEKVTLPEFLIGCLTYTPTQFKDVTPAQTALLQELTEAVKKHILKELTGVEDENTNHERCTH